MRIAFIGCGGIANTHAESYRRLAAGRVELITASRSADKAWATAQRFKALGGLSPYSVAFEDARISGVFILTPHHVHVEPTVEALRHGKDVYLEKPVARTVEEAEPIGRALAERRGQIVMVGEQYRYAPPLVQAVEMLRRGEVGELRAVTVQCLYCVRPEGWRVRREFVGGGGLIDGGIHQIQGLRMIGGDIASVFAREPAGKWNQIEGEETIQLLLRFGSGATATMIFSWAFHGEPAPPEFLILGTEGSIAVSMRGKANRVNKGIPVKSRETYFARRFGRVDLYSNLGYVNAMAEFLDCMKSRRKPAVDFTEGLRDLRVVEAAYRSLASGREETVEPLPPWAEGV